MRRWLFVLFAVLAVAVTGCSTGDRGSDDERYRGFYGGVSGGTMGP